MRKLYLFLVHDISHTLETSLDLLSENDENTILIHVDKNKNIDDFKYLERKNIHFIDERVYVTWGGWSVVDATLKLLYASLDFDYEYCFLVSGDDLPIMTNDEVNNYLSIHNGVDYIHYQDSRDDLCDPDVRVFFKYRKFHFRKKKNIYEKIQTKLFSLFKNILFTNKLAIYQINKLNIKIFKGTQWFTLRKATILKLFSYINENPSLIDVFKYSYCPDEIFFHSVLRKLDDIRFYKNEGKMNDALRYIDWRSGPDYPKELDLYDINIIRGEEYFFARKISRKLSTLFFDEYKKKMRNGKNV